MNAQMIFFIKSHVSQHVRKDGVVVKDYDNKKVAKPKKDWRDEENWHTRTMGKFAELSDDSLRYIIKDAREAADAIESHNPNSKKASQYRDEVHYAVMELNKRKKAAGGK